MLHLTVDAWRLQRLQSFPQLTSHTCNRPADFTQEAHAASVARHRIFSHKYGFLFCSGTHLCMCTRCPEPGLHCQDRLDRGELRPSPAGRMHWPWGILFTVRPRLCVSLWGKQLVLFGRLLGRLACVMINSNGPHDHSWKCCRTKTEGSRVGRPLTGRVRDGCGGMDVEGRGFRKCCFDEPWRRREERGAQSSSSCPG